MGIFAGFCLSNLNLFLNSTSGGEKPKANCFPKIYVWETGSPYYQLELFWHWWGPSLETTNDGLRQMKIGIELRLTMPVLVVVLNTININNLVDKQSRILWVSHDRLLSSRASMRRGAGNFTVKKPDTLPQPGDQGEDPHW